MYKKFSLDNKAALITGASGGLGAHFAETLSDAGATVIAAGRRRQPLDALVQRLQKRGAKSHAITMDVTNQVSIAAAFNQAQEHCGMIGVVVCCAGVATTKKSLDLSVDEWDKVVDTNLKGSWMVCNEAARRLVQAGQPGSIINVTSILGHRVAGSVLPYTTAKAGLEQMTRALALEWARYGIRVNALAPGYIETDLNREFFSSQAGQAMVNRIPQRRLGQCADLDGALLLLASDASAYITGSSIVVDGGHLQSSL
jgi:Dehydrogenases with different specificities (related to short-chain alcohol dehydrogenases)